MVQPAKITKQIVMKKPHSIIEPKTDQKQVFVNKQKLDAIRERTIKKIKNYEHSASDVIVPVKKITKRKPDNEEKIIDERVNKVRKIAPEITTVKSNKVELKKVPQPSTSALVGKNIQLRKKPLKTVDLNASTEVVITKNKVEKVKNLSPVMKALNKNIKQVPVSNSTTSSTSTTKTNNQKETQSMSTIYKQKITCKYCNLKFVSASWHAKHLRRSHADLLRDEGIEIPAKDPILTVQTIDVPVLKAEKVIFDDSADSTGEDDAPDAIEFDDPAVVYNKQVKLQQNVLREVKKQAQKTNEMQKTLAMQTKLLDTKVNKKKAATAAKDVKKSPKKHLMRNILKEKLAQQQRLLQMQQQIFEEANKAQSDILNMISNLDKMESDEEPPEEEQENKEENEEEDTEEGESEKESEEAENSQAELIKFTNIHPTNDEHILPDDEDSMIVVVRTDDGEEEFELFEIDESAEFDENKPSVIQEEDVSYDEEETPVVFEIVGGDGDNIHYRIVEGNEIATSTDPLEYSTSSSSVVKKVLKRSDIPDEFSSEKVSDKISTSKGNNNKINASSKKKKGGLLNDTKKDTNELSAYIQGIVRHAEPNEDNKFSCPICTELVSNRYSLGPHILRVHSKQKSKVCPYCDRAFTCTGDLTRHIRIHTGDKPFVCNFPNCTYAFRASGDLYKHIRRHTATDDVTARPHVCDECGRRFERNYDLKRHSLTHRKDDESIGFKCNHCSKRFFRKDQYKAHMYRHMGIKPYKCPDCGRLFGDFSNCSKHIKQKSCTSDADPTGEKKYMCEKCMKRFKSKAGIKLHFEKCQIKRD